MVGHRSRREGRRLQEHHDPCARGGSIEDPEKLLSHAFGAEKARQLISRARSACVQLARQIESASGHSHGEMSMDLGVDAAGGLWFFEANSKPMKFDEPHIRKKSLERIFHYGSYLMRSPKPGKAGGA